MRVVGIIGGMGPQATVDLLQRIIDVTPARRDQEHLQILICNDPTIPDRTRAILGKGQSPLPKLLSAAKGLIAGGAEFLAIPCNTAHYFLPALQRGVNVPFLNMPSEVARYLREKDRNIKQVGLLATDGTLAAGVYENALRERGLAVINPEPGQQEIVMEVIYGKEGIKAGVLARRQSELLEGVIRGLQERGAGAVIAGCTELSSLFGRFPCACGAELVSANDILAQAIVREATAPVVREQLG